MTILPPELDLRTPESRHRLVLREEANGQESDATRKAEWSSANAAVARVDAAGIVTPVASGETTITAKTAKGTAAARVRVTIGAEFHWSFRNHIIPVLTKMGCNQGACHGALAGKNGFKLTLRGYDPELDFDAITRQSVGRRVSPGNPSASLILRKATFAMPHGGGKRFAEKSLEYRVISEWIGDGMAGPKANDATVTGLEVFPARAILAPEAEQQLVVRARYSDGRTEDVTRWAKFSSANEGVALVNDNGLVKMTGKGEAAIPIWYASKVLYARVTAPFERRDASAYAHFLPANLIDEQALAKWKALGFVPSKTATDEAFLRRVYLDATGTLPTPEQVEEFLADASAGKRAKLIDKLLESPEYADFWAYKWSDLLLVSSRKLRTNAMWTFYNWIHDSVKENKPWDRFAREIFTGTGSTREHGALNYYVLHKDTIDLAENVTQAFLGQRLTCARCHNHPLEKWTQKQYYQFANLFARVGVKNGDAAGENVIFAQTSGDIDHPRLRQPLPPAPLDGEALPLDSTADRRVPFAEWLTVDNEYFVKNIVNRVWGNLMGRGLSDPIDDVRATNPASNEELFDALCKHFVASGYDMKGLIRLILNSSAYQLSSEANATNQSDNVYYSKYIVKRLPGEVILDSMSQVTGVASKFGGYPAGTRALQLPDVRVQSQFLTVFGRPNRILCDAAERSQDPSISQALHVINGDTLNLKLADPNGYLAMFQKIGLSDARIVEQLTMAALSRYPSAEEKKRLAGELAKVRAAAKSPEEERRERKQALEDMAWAMLTSKEFLFNH
ncbi:MAG: DUF1549 domain-containing protein [Bryobacteraceae bacterium]